MPQEFPSIINASGLVNANAVNNTERGATTTLNGVIYTITLERGLGLGFAICHLFAAGGAVIPNPVLVENDHTSPTTFQIQWAPSQAGTQATQAFFYTIIAIDESL